MPVYVPCPPICLSIQDNLRQMLGTFGLSLSVFTYVPSPGSGCSMGVFVCAYDEEEAGQGTFGRVWWFLKRGKSESSEWVRRVSISWSCLSPGHDTGI